jgi:hypothetical protein
MAMTFPRSCSEWVRYRVELRSAAARPGLDLVLDPALSSAGASSTAPFVRCSLIFLTSSGDGDVTTTRPS